MNEADIYHIIDKRRSELGLTQVEVSRLAFDRSDTALIQNLRRGKPPNFKTLGALCRALDLEFYIGPPRDGGDSAAAAATTLSTAGLETFDPGIDMGVRGYAKCSLVGHLEGEEQYRDLPMPTGLREIDADSFYVIAKGPSMIPDGIEPGDYCLVSPNTPVAAGLRVWLQDRQGRACIKRLMTISDKTYALRGWIEAKMRRQQSYDDEWMVSNVAGKGVVLAVYRGRPDVSDPPPLIADPKPPVSTSVIPREIATALGLPESATVPEMVKAIEARSGTGFDAEALQEKVATVVKAETGALREEVTAAREAQAEALSRLRTDLAEDLADASALTAAHDADAPEGARPVDVIELASAAGGGAEVLSEEVTGRVWFRRDWLDEYGLDATRCAVIGVMGCSMEPTLMDGAKILIDRRRTARSSGDIFVLRTTDGLVVKRLTAGRASGWQLVSDHPGWDPVPWPDDAEIIGRVVWTARTLIGEDR